MENKKVTIMQILPALHSGGVERGAVDIAKALKKEGMEPIVVSSGGIMVFQLRDAKIRHITLNVKSKNPLQIFRNIKKIANLIKENHVDIVHVRSRAPMISAYLACKKTKTKLLSTVHGTYSLKLGKIKNFIFKRLYNAFMLKADHIIAVSQFIKNYILDNYQPFTKQPLAEKITVIQRGVDINYFSLESISMTRKIQLTENWNIPEDKKIIVFPARITAWKGHEFLINALAKVKSDYFCVFVGSDHGHKKFRKKLEQKIIKEGLAGRIKLVGTTKEMPVAYAIANLVISASIKPEAFGRIAIEAQAMKKLIIATNIGGSLETIIDKETGFLCEVGNAGQLAQMIDEVLSMPKEESDRICANARAHVEKNFSNQKMCADTIAVYRDILVGASPCVGLHVHSA